MNDFLIIFLTITNAFTLIVLRNILGYYSKRVTQLENEVTWVSLEVRALK